MDEETIGEIEIGDRGHGVGIEGVDEETKGEIGSRDREAETGIETEIEIEIEADPGTVIDTDDSF